LLSRLGSDEQTRGKVVPLAFHVDYWNVGGWTDPFSAHAWTLRQEAYQLTFGVQSYTPQLVVNGHTEVNGSNAPRVLAEIAADLQSQPGATISLTASRGEGSKPTVTVDVTAAVTEAFKARKLKAQVALFESGLVTAVARGENHGRTLQNDFIVRRFETAFTLEPKAGAHGQQAITLKLEPGWKLENLGVAAFLQDPGSMKIHAAAVQSVR